MGEIPDNVIYVDFPDHSKSGPRLRLPECFYRPRFWRRVVAPLGVLGLAGSLTAYGLNQEVAPSPYVCTVGVTSPGGDPTQTVQNAAHKAGIEGNPRNLARAAGIVYDLAGGTVYPGERYSICFSGDTVDLGSIHEDQPGSEPGLLPSGAPASGASHSN